MINGITLYQRIQYCVESVLTEYYRIPSVKRSSSAKFACTTVCLAISGVRCLRAVRKTPHSVCAVHYISILEASENYVLQQILLLRQVLENTELPSQAECRTFVTNCDYSAQQGVRNVLERF